MKIGFDLTALITLSRYRGIGVYLFNILKNIKFLSADHELVLIYPEIDSVATSELQDKLKFLDYQFRLLPYYLITSSEYTASLADLNAKLFDSFVSGLGLDVLHRSTWFEEPLWINPGLAIRSSNLIQTATFHDLIPLFNRKLCLSHGDNIANTYFKKLDNFLLNDSIFTVSETSRHEFLEVFPHACTKTYSTPNAANDLLSASQSPENSDVIYQLGIDKQYLFYVGGYDGRKNIGMLIEAYAKIKNNSEYYLVLAGDIHPNTKESFEVLAERLGVRPNLKILGWQEDKVLISLYKNAALFVFPSISEGFGMPPLEAMELGCPVAASNIPVMQEVVQNSECFFDPKSSTSIASKINQILGDSELRQSLINRGFLAAKKFSWHSTVSRMAAIWEYLYSIKKPAKHHHDGHKVIDYFKYISRFMTLQEQQFVEENMNVVASVIDKNQNIVNNFSASINNINMNVPTLSIKLEGPYDSSYSLAIVNRELAYELNKKSSLSLLSAEGGGEYIPNDQIFEFHPWLRDLNLVNFESIPIDSNKISYDVVTRNMYPPRTTGMEGFVNSYHSYGWEESEFPQEWVSNFNSDLDFVTTVSTFARNILINSGVFKPIAVTHNASNISNIVSEEIFPKEKKFRFLHISSCFPRKGIDTLLKAYVETFQWNTEVELFIHTFPNPHNDVQNIIDEILTKYQGVPQITVNLNSLTQEQIKGLYTSSDCFVCLSRGEGFGLPFVESIHCNIPVIATAYSGQMDFLDDSSSLLVDYTFAKSYSHFYNPFSVWAEPNFIEIKEKLFQMYSLSSSERLAMAMNAQHKLEKLTWKKTANDFVDIANKIISKKKNVSYISAPKLKVGFLTSWNVKCGIAEYSKQIINRLPFECTIFSNRTNNLISCDGKNVVRCFDFGGSLEELIIKISDSGINVLIIQWNFGFFAYKYLIDAISSIKRMGIKIIFGMHSTLPPSHVNHLNLKFLSTGLRLVDRIYCHTISDLNNLKNVGLVNNTMIIPHGFEPVTLRPYAQKECLTFGSFGFLLPQKNIPNLIKGFSIFLEKTDHHNAKLSCLNALYPNNSDSLELKDHCLELIDELELDGIVNLNTNYISYEQMYIAMNDIDLACYPYTQHNESCSGAVRNFISSGGRIIVTDIRMFEDISSLSLLFNSSSPQDIATGMLTYQRSFFNNSEAHNEYCEQLVKMNKFLSWDIIAKRFVNLSRSLIVNSD